MIKQTREQAKDTRALKHFTRLHYFNSIADIGIQLEGYNEEQYQIEQNGRYICDNPFLKTLGRYVWLTKGRQAEVINSIAHNNNDKEFLNELQSITAPILVDDEGLELVSWKLLKQQLSRKKKARQMIDAFEMIAKQCGDNTDDWFVSKTFIPSSHLYSFYNRGELIPLRECADLMARQIMRGAA